jgi:hypothetical protein
MVSVAMVMVMIVRKWLINNSVSTTAAAQAAKSNASGNHQYTSNSASNQYSKQPTCHRITGQ